MGGGMGSCMLSESLSLLLLYGGSEAPYWRWWWWWCWWWWPSFPAIERATVERSSSEGGVVKWDCPCPLAVVEVRAFLVFAVELAAVELARLPCGLPPGFRTGFVRSQCTPRLTHLPHLPSASKSSRPGTRHQEGSARGNESTHGWGGGGSVHFFFIPLHEKQPE